MNPTYEKLYDLYADDILKEAAIYDEPALRAFVERFPLDSASQLQLLDQFFESYLHWTLDAFSVGLQLGLRLQAGPGLRQ